MDHFYVGMAHFIRDGFAEFIRLIDSGIDSIVDGIGRLTSDACGIAKSIDEKYVDGTVQKLSNGTFAIGRWLRRQQTGVLQNYNQQLVIGLITIMIVILTYFYIYPNFL
jgi:hypothetical protein